MNFFSPRLRLSRLAVLTGMGVLGMIPAHAGLVFNISYSAAVQSNANFGNIQTAINYVAGEYSALYTDNVTLNFLVDQTSSGLGASLFSPAAFRGSYAQVEGALVADAKSADDASFNASLPGSDPNNTFGGLNSSDDWVVTSANAKALGLLSGTNAASDGTFFFSTSVTYTYDPNNRGTGGFDFIGVAEHEFSELMGRTTQIGNAGFGNMVFDLARFTASTTRSFANTGAGVYFSIDNGVTNLKNYNSGSGDIQDWDSSVATDPYNASTGSDQAHFISPVGIQTLDVIGWDSAVPEPAFFVPVAAALGLMLLRRKRA